MHPSPREKSFQYLIGIIQHFNSPQRGKMRNHWLGFQYLIGIIQHFNFGLGGALHRLGVSIPHRHYTAFQPGVFSSCCLLFNVSIPHRHYTAFQPRLETLLPPVSQFQYLIGIIQHFNRTHGERPSRCNDGVSIPHRHYTAFQLAAYWSIFVAEFQYLIGIIQHFNYRLCSLHFVGYCFNTS